VHGYDPILPAFAVAHDDHASHHPNEAILSPDRL